MRPNRPHSPFYLGGNLKKPVIVMIAAHACVRVQKMALPLLDKGYDVHLIADKVPSFVERYTTFTKTHDLGQLIEAVKLYSNIADIFHAHNEPSWFVTVVKENTDIPVVLDVHDSYLARSTPEEADKAAEEGKTHLRITHEERNNFQLADGLVYPADPFAKLVSGEFGLSQLQVVLPSFLPRRLYRYDCRERLGGLLYEGKVDLRSEVEEGRGFDYCEYEDLAKQTRKLGIDLHFYTIRPDRKFLDIYEPMSYTHEPMDYDTLLKNITRHDWGFVGNVRKTAEWEVAFPNKLFEYIAGCVPIVSMNARTCGDFIEEHKIGVAVKSLEELRERWAEHRECRINLIKKRQQWTMENHIHKLEELYEGVINERK